MTAETIAGLAGILLSLALAYVPGLAPRWQALPGDWKRLILAGCLALIAFGSLGLACTPLVEDRLFPAGLVNCEAESALQIVSAFITALIANQSTYTLAVQGRVKITTRARA